MNILVITPGFLPTIGGAEIGVHEIYSRLGQRHRVNILTASQAGQPPPPEGFEPGGYTVRRYSDWLNFGRVGGRMLLRGALPPFSLGALYAAAKAIRQLQPDVVNVHYAAYTGLAALWAQNVSGVPTVLSLIGRDSVPGPGVPALWPWYASRIARGVAHTVFVSEFCRSYYKEHPFPQSVIPYGTDTHRIRPQPADEALRRELGLPPGQRVLFSLQRLSPIKRVEVAIYSLADLLDQGLSDVVLIIGGTGPDENRLRQLVRARGLERHVKFTGYLSEADIPRFFSLADVFVFPSIFETFGIVLAQAMAAGVPTAACNCSSIPELIQDGVTGLLSPPLDHRALAENIRRLLEDEGLRQRIGRAARQRALALYDWDLVAGQYEGVLSLAAGRRRRTRADTGGLP